MLTSCTGTGQNGFGGAFGTLTPQGNGNQEKEEEQAQPEEPVSPSPCFLFSCPWCCESP